MYKLIQKAVNFIVSPRQVLISSFGQLYRIVEALFVIFIALFIKIVASGYAMFFLKAYLHGTTLSHATSLRQAYDMT